MRTVLLMALLAGCCAAATAESVVEATTKTAFDATLSLGDTALACTGVGLRRVYGMSIYAIAHYGDPADAAPGGATPEERLAHWIAAGGKKALVIRFVFHADQHNLRVFAASALDEAGYTGKAREELLDAFARDYAPGSEARLLADGKRLRVDIDGKTGGTWEDGDLVRALWQCWLGEKSVLESRAALVARDMPTP
jgi:hypothetical protein